MFRAKTYGYHDIHRLAEQLKDVDDFQKLSQHYESKILFATSLGGELGVVKLESLLATALKFKKVDCQFLLCDGILPACQLCTYLAFNDRIDKFIEEGPQKLFCPSCYKDARKAIEALGFKVHAYSDFLKQKEKNVIQSILDSTTIESIPGYRIDSIPVGEHALAGALRFMTRSSLPDTGQGRDVLKRYFEAALKTTLVTQNLLQQNDFDCVVAHHGIYVPQGIIVQTARANSVRVVSWNVAYRAKTFVFSHGDSYHHTMIDEPVSEWQQLEWDQKKEEKLNYYLQSRLKGTGDWITFQDEDNEMNSDSQLNQWLGGRNEKCVLLLTSVLWDAQVHYQQNAFTNIVEWVLFTINYFKKRPDLKLVIRIHPAEVRNKLPSKQQMVYEINAAYPTLPKNVLLLHPTHSVTSYEVASRSHCCLIYSTKMGVELSAKGIPIIVSGEAWIRNKGFSHDSSSKEEYIQLLDKIPNKIKMTPQQILLAKKYAYHFFFRRMIPIEGLESAKGWPPYKISSNAVAILCKDNIESLNCVTEGVMHEKSFVLG